MNRGYFPTATVPTGRKVDKTTMEIGFADDYKRAKTNFTLTPIRAIQGLGQFEQGQTIETYPKVVVERIARTYNVDRMLARLMLRHFGLSKAQAILKQHGRDAYNLLPEVVRYRGGFGDLSGITQKIAEFRSSETGQVLSTFSDLATLILLGVTLWFVFPVLKRARPWVAGKVEHHLH